MTFDYSREELSIHYGPGWPELPKAIFIHSTRSGVSGRASLDGHDKEAQSTYNWFKSSASNASTNAIVSPRETILCVPDDKYAYHAKEHSFVSLSIEITQAKPSYGYYAGQYKRAADLCHYWCEKFNIPKVYRSFYVNGYEGLTGHEDSEQGVRDGKSDPGSNWDWDKFITILKGLDEVEIMDKTIKWDGTYAWAQRYGHAWFIPSQEQIDAMLLRGWVLTNGPRTLDRIDW